MNIFKSETNHEKGKRKERKKDRSCFFFLKFDYLILKMSVYELILKYFSLNSFAIRRLIVKLNVKVLTQPKTKQKHEKA